MVARNESLRLTVAAMLDAGTPVSQIAAQLNITRQRVYKIAAELGYRFERQRLKPIKPAVRSSP